jgi:hypothetical protein
VEFIFKEVAQIRRIRPATKTAGKSRGVKDSSEKPWKYMVLKDLKRFHKPCLDIYRITGKFREQNRHIIVLRFRIRDI